MYLNAQSVIKKMNELRANMNEKQPDVVLIVEAWTHEGVDDAFLKISGLELIERKDRSDTTAGRGGGILIYVRKELCAWKEEMEGGFNQAGKIVVKGEREEIAINLVYRSPNSKKENDTKLCERVKTMEGHFVIFGDFNFPGIDWGTGQSDAKGRELVTVVENKFISQHVNEATHVSGNTLDLIFSSSENLIGNVERDGRIGGSDHETLICTVGFPIERKDKIDMVRDYAKGNYEEMRKNMNMNWEQIMEHMTVEESWNMIKMKLEEETEKNVPYRERKEKCEPRWMTREIKTLMGKKKRMWKKARSGNAKAKEDYKKVEKELKKKIRNGKSALERKVAKNAKQNPRLFYSYLKGERGNRQRVGPLKDENGQLIVDPKHQAEVLNEYFASVFTSYEGSELPTKEAMEMKEGNLEDIRFEAKKIEEKIQEMRTESAPGPDGISPRILKEVAHQISTPLAMLFNKSMQNGSIPDDWRKANVTPLFKKGSKFVPGNYRPVSLTSVLCKTMERLVKDKLIQHLEANEVISDSQHGFRKGKSCQTNLLEFMEKMTEWADNGSAIDVVYLDFAKAFDKVCHERLMVKVEAAGITGKVSDWLHDWLKNRVQRVILEGEESGWIKVISSVVQGSVLGSTLFNIFIDDIDNAIESLLKKFADDTKAAKAIKDERDRDSLQRDIDVMDEWAQKWEMEFNVGKCKVMHIGKNNPKYEYEMKGQKMSETVKEKDLGVLIENNLKPSAQCEAAAKKANQVLGQITRSFHYQKKDVFMQLFKTFVRPHLEYASSVWCPWTEKDCETLEKVQQRAVRMVSDFRGVTYEEKLKEAGMTTLKERRKRGDLIETFKVMNGFDKVKRETWFRTISEAEREKRSMRQNSQMNEDGEVESKGDIIIQKKARNDTRWNFFSLHVTRDWNRIPKEVREAKSVNSFKNGLDAYLEDIIYEKSLRENGQCELNNLQEEV